MSATVTRRPRFGLEFARAGAPHPGPPGGAPLRVSFVGQSTFFEATPIEPTSPCSPTVTPLSTTAW